ncbi:MAG: hypothetical protein WCX88_04125 [Patescibacteria group bacterium]
MTQTKEETIATLTKCCNEYAKLVKEMQIKMNETNDKFDKLAREYFELTKL